MFCEIESLLNQLAFDYDVLFPCVFINVYCELFSFSRFLFPFFCLKCNIASGLPISLPEHNHMCFVVMMLLPYDQFLC